MDETHPLLPMRSHLCIQSQILNPEGERISMKFKDYIAYWYNTYRKAKHTSTTVSTTVSIIKNHIVSEPWADNELSEITTKQLQEYLTQLLLSGNKCKLKNWKPENNHLSNATVKKIRQLIIACFNQAKKECLIINNPAEMTESIPYSPRMPEIFANEAQVKFLKHTRNHRFYVAYVLLFYTGCRRGEILGLSWDNIHWRENTIVIKQTNIMENGIPKIKERTKTIKSTRIIPIPKEIKDLLREHQRNQQREKRLNLTWNNPYNLVFTNKDGSIYNPMYFSRNFKNTVCRMGLSKNLHCHCTRHTWATNMIQIGIPITDVQAIGGWSRPDILLNIYAHAIKKTQAKAMNKLYKTIPLES